MVSAIGLASGSTGRRLTPSTKRFILLRSAAESATPPVLRSSQAFADHTLPHLEGAYRLARQLTRNSQDALDVVQEAYLRALRFSGGFRGGDARPWLLEIVRNVFYSSVRHTRPMRTQTNIEPDDVDVSAVEWNPETALIESLEKRLMRNAISELPGLYRAVLTLRDLEGLPYKEIAKHLRFWRGR